MFPELTTSTVPRPDLVTEKASSSPGSPPKLRLRSDLRSASSPDCSASSPGCSTWSPGSLSLVPLDLLARLLGLFAWLFDLVPGSLSLVLLDLLRRLLGLFAWLFDLVPGSLSLVPLDLLARLLGLFAWLFDLVPGLLSLVLLGAVQHGVLAGLLDLVVLAPVVVAPVSRPISLLGVSSGRAVLAVRGTRGDQPVRHVSEESYGLPFAGRGARDCPPLLAGRAKPAAMLPEGRWLLLDATLGGSGRPSPPGQRLGGGPRADGRPRRGAGAGALAVWSIPPP